MVAGGKIVPARSGSTVRASTTCAEGSATSRCSRTTLYHMTVAKNLAFGLKLCKTRARTCSAVPG
jgi:hypothetical protein